MSELPRTGQSLQSQPHHNEGMELLLAQQPLLWRRLLEQADLCLQHAKEAEHGGRFSAACGLCLTAQELLQLALATDCSSLDHLVLERALAERLQFAHREMARLLQQAVRARLSDTL